MLPPQADPHADAVASAVAASMWNVLDLIMKLPAPEAFERIKLHIETAITAYTQGVIRRTFPAPSEN